MTSTGGAIQQLIQTSEEYQDQFLTGYDPKTDHNKPKHNFVKQNYRKYENYAIERIPIYSTDLVDFGRQITFKIKKSGDFLKKLYFSFTLPKLTVSSGTYAGWTNALGFAIIDYCYIKINNVELAREYGLHMDMQDELNNDPGTRNGDNILIGKYQNLGSLKFNAVGESSYQVELPFWFGKNIGSALPFLSLNRNDSIEIVMKLRPFNECIVYDGTIHPATVHIQQNSLLTDQIFMTDSAKRKFKGGKHVYIIKQTQYISDDIAGISKKLDIPFSHPLNQLLFVIREHSSDLNNDWFNYSIRNVVPHTPVYSLLDRARLLVDSKPRNEYQTANELSILNSKAYYTNTIDKFIYTMPFCSDPGSWYPNGTFNFSVPQSKELHLEMTKGIEPSSVHLFGVNFNFLVIEPGIVRLMYNT